jgi:hypothetical protein
MLTDPGRRGEAIAGSPGGAAADAQGQALAGSPELSEEIYRLAATIFEEITRDSGGDIAKVSEALERGQRDPAGFAAMLSPGTQQRLRELGVKITDRRR